jgi:outer membrane receptor protein involved in Fe transport
MGQYTYTDSRVSYNNSPTGLSLPAYSLVNLRAGFNQGPWQAALFVKNLFNTLGVTGDLLPDGAQLPDRPRLFVTRPRTIGIQIRRDF